MEDALIVHQPPRILLMEECRHRRDILARIGLISERPDQYRRMILVPLIHGPSPVNNRLLPLGKVAGHIP